MLYTRAGKDKIAMEQYIKRHLFTAVFHRSVRLIIMLSSALFLLACMSATLGLSERPVIAQSYVKIMPLGDSITFGVHSTKNGGYRVTLWNVLQAAHLHITFVGSEESGPDSLPEKANEGHPGWRIDQISAHIVAWLEKYQPRIILLHIGTNDIIQNHSVSTAPARLHSLLVQITTTLPDATVIVAQLIPLGNSRLDAKVIAYNKTIPGIVSTMQAQGKHVRYVNMYNAVPLRDIPDHIHPDNLGYTLMASVWYKALQPLL